MCRPMGPMTDRLKKTIFTLGRVLLSAVLLALLLYFFRDKLPEVAAKVSRARLVPLLIAAFWYVVFIFVSSWRWQVLLAAKGMRFSIWYLARVFTLSLFFCKLLPTSIGGDVFRIAYTAPKDRAADAFSATLLDRLVGFVSLLLLAVVVAFGLFATSAQARALELPIAGIRFQGLGIVALLMAGLVLLLVLALVLFNDTAHRCAQKVFSLIGRIHIGRVRFSQLGEQLDRAYDAVKQYRHHGKALLLSFTSGIGVQIALVFSWYSIATAISGTVPLVYYFIFIPLLNIIVNIPTIGGLGVREWAFVLLFTPSWLTGRLSQELALASALLFLALDLVFALLGGVLFAIMRRRQPLTPCSASSQVGSDGSTLDSLNPFYKEDRSAAHS